MRESLAYAAGIPEDRIVLNHSYIGGDFGGKGTSLDLPICYYLAKASGRPVRMVPDYVEEFMAGNPRHETVIRLRTGVKRDGSLTAHHVQFIVNSGAYAGYKPRGTIGGANQAAGPYVVPNTRIESTHAYTNTVPGGHMRAPGEPQGVFAIESHMDEIARAIGMDPYDFRMKNLVDEGDETAFGERLHEVNAKETLRRAAEATDYHTAKGENVGRGIAMGDRGPGGGQGNAEITLAADGSVLLKTPIFDQGTGTYTTLRQVVAEELQGRAGSRQDRGLEHGRSRIRLRHRRQPRYARERIRGVSDGAGREAGAAPPRRGAVRLAGGEPGPEGRRDPPYGYGRGGRLDGAR